MSYSKQTSIDIPSCPRGHGNLTPLKTWTLKAKAPRSNKETGTKVTAWRCKEKLANGKECGYSHRTFNTLKEKQQ